MTMIALPVLVITAFLTFAMTAEVSPQEGMGVVLGTADARLVLVPEDTTLRQTPNGAVSNTDGERATAPERTADEVAALLGPGTRLLPFSTGVLLLGAERVEALQTDLRDPLTRGC
ncbi:hypothetical protein ACFQYP_41160 [Nonomuraea antimicrobica]